MTKFEPAAWDAILDLLDNGDVVLGDRVNEMLDLLEDDWGNASLRRHRTQQKPAAWIIKVRGRDDEFWIAWDIVDAEPRVRYAGYIT